MPVTSRLLVNLAVLIGGGLTLAFCLDWLAGQLGFHPGLFCMGIGPAIAIAHALGMLLTAVGIIIWAFSFLRSQGGLILMIGGFMLFGMTLVLPHYLGASCNVAPLAVLRQTTNYVTRHPSGGMAYQASRTVDNSQ